MKVFWQTFLHSLQLPKKQAVFALNRIGMDITVIYLFIFLAIASIPALVDQLTTDQSTEVQTFFLLIFFFIFTYLPSVVMTFAVISLFAYLATLLAKILERRLHFAILWKMLASALTIPLLLFTIVSFFYPLSLLFLTLCTMYILFIIIKIILIYPRMKKA